MPSGSVSRGSCRHVTSAGATHAAAVLLPWPARGNLENLAPVRIISCAEMHRHGVPSS